MFSIPARFVVVCVALFGWAAVAFDFVGSENCQSCHPEAYAAWRASSHARSKEALSPVQQHNARCLSCHSPSEAETKRAHVSCESCHGGGQYYASRYVMKDPELARLVGLVDPTEKLCRSCHDESTPSVRPFDFASALKAIDHWTAEREAAGAKRNAEVRR